jgi:hypothetical protein
VRSRAVDRASVSRACLERSPLTNLTIRFAVVDGKWESSNSSKTRGEGAQDFRRDSRDNFLGPQVNALALEADEARAECCYIENDHDKSEEIHSHH